MVEIRDGVRVRYGIQKGRKRGEEILNDRLERVDIEPGSGPEPIRLRDTSDE